jgi:hypothetical protein
MRYMGGMCTVNMFKTKHELKRNLILFGDFFAVGSTGGM